MGLTVAAIVLFVLLTVGIGYVVVQGIRLWRAVKRLGQEAGPKLDHISQTTAEIEGQLQRASASGERLRDAAQRLSTSRARLDVQLSAVREARAQLKRLVWFLPGA